MARDSWATMNGSTRLVDAEDARHAVGALLTPGSSALNTRAGLRPGPGTPGAVAATGTPGANVTVNAFQGMLPATRGTNNPPYIVTEPAQLTVAILDVPADPSNQRNDLIIFRQYDTFYTDGSTLAGVIRVQGSPSASPADPSLAAYPDYLLLGRVRVTAGATTITNAMIDDLRPGWMVGLGGVLPVKSLTDRATLTHWNGFTIYRLDKGWYETSDGTAWRIRSGLVTVTALADITDPFTDQLAYLTTDHLIYRWSGSAWVAWTSTGGTTAATRHKARYFQNGSPQNIPNTAQQRISFNTNSFVTNDWTTSTVSGGTKFTCAREGSWDIKLNSRLALAAAGERGLTIANDAFSRVLGIASGGTQGTLPWSGSVSVEDDFSVGDDFCCWFYQASGGTVALDLAAGPTSVTMSYRGPKST